MSPKMSQVTELIDEMIRMSDFSFVRLPMLEIVGRRLAGFLPVALGDLTNCMCEASLNQLDYLPLGQAAAAFPDPMEIAICSSPLLDGDFLLVMDAPLIFSCLETSLGGQLSGREVDAGERFTAIERGFAKRLARLILGELRQAFTVIGDIAPSLERLETEVESAAVTQQASLCIRLDFGLKVGSQHTRLTIVIPYNALEPLRPQLSKVYFGERGEDENPWQTTLTRQIESATVELEVVLSEISIPMREIMAFKPGDKIELSAREDSESSIHCSGTPLFHCVTGTRRNGAAAVRITEEINVKEEA